MITSLQELIEELPKCSGSDYVRIAKNMQIPVSDFDECQSWDKESYTRNCLSRTDEYELILLCWEPCQKTPVHGHGGEECWVYMVDGLIRERHFSEEVEGGSPLPSGKSEIMRPGQLSYMNDMMGFHTLENIHSGRSMSLHLYMNPIDRCRVFDKDKKKFVVKEMEYDQVIEEEII